MKILVTSGTGFIGSALVRQLLADSRHHAVNVDKFSYAGNLESLPGAEGHLDIASSRSTSATPKPRAPPSPSTTRTR